MTIALTMHERYAAILPCFQALVVIHYSGDTVRIPLRIKDIKTMLQLVTVNSVAMTDYGNIMLEFLHIKISIPRLK